MKKFIILFLPFILFSFSCSSDSSSSSNSEEIEIPEKKEPEKPQDDNNDKEPSEKDDEEDSDDKKDDEDDSKPNIPPKVEEKVVNQFFWGKWICMADGNEISINEKSVITNNQTKKILSSTEEKLSISDLGTFEKQTDSVIINNNIPYFRNGGVNLPYSLKLVGFSESQRAASSSSLAGYKVQGQSNTYSSFITSTESKDDGTINLVAPVLGDTQKVSIEMGNETIIIPGITISNSNDYLGTIPIVSSNDYVLKVSGIIEDSEKIDGYLYANNSKEYSMKLSITNISDVSSSYSLCKITPADSKLKITLSEDLRDGFPISTLKPSAKKEIALSVSYEDLTEGYVNTGLNIEITNGKTGQVWVDFIPLRFYKGYIPITISASSTESNDEASLNGFIVYPDGNSKFFQVSNDSSETIYVPSFLSNEKYLLSFSGATVEGNLSDSTEMFYSVKIGSNEPKEIIKTASEILNSFYYGEPNENEYNAFSTESEFQAYIGDGEIDYF